MLEAQFSGTTGRGIGRYGAGQLADVTFRPDGSLTANPETMFLAGLILHAWPGLDLYAYAGEEYESRNFGFTPLGTNNFVGLGNPVIQQFGLRRRTLHPLLGQCPRGQVNHGRLLAGYL